MPLRAYRDGRVRRYNPFSVVPLILQYLHKRCRTPRPGAIAVVVGMKPSPESCLESCEVAFPEWIQIIGIHTVLLGPLFTSRTFLDF